jgi:hypothetical protein
MIPENPDLYILGMNIGSEPGGNPDYEMLLPHTVIDRTLSVQQAFTNYSACKKKTLMERKAYHALPKQSQTPEARANLEKSNSELALAIETLFSYLHGASEIEIQESDHAELAELLFREGLDVLNRRLTSGYEGRFYRSLVEKHLDGLLTVIEKSMSDEYGAKQMIENYPNLCAYLRETFPGRFAPILDKFRALDGSTIGSIAKKPLATNALRRQLQSVRDRLSTTFFETIAAQPNKPAVLTLQEVGSNQPVLSALAEARYLVYRAHDTSDTAIAIDASRFSNCKNVSETGNYDYAAVHAVNRERTEEYIFISVHIRGYDLEIPENPGALQGHLQGVEQNLAGGPTQDIQKLDDQVKRLKKLYPKAQIIVQGDFNTYPEYFSNRNLTSKIKKLNPFSKLKKAFSLLRTGEATQLNPNSSTLRERELDYALTSKRLAKRVQLVSPDDQGLTLAKVSGLTSAKDKRKKWFFDPMLLFSDHRPMWFKISPKKPKKSNDP